MSWHAGITELVQCKFEYGNGPELTSQTAWIDASWNLRVGQYVSFKFDARQWRVAEVGTVKQTFRDVDRTWTVGGNTQVTGR